MPGPSGSPPSARGTPGARSSCASDDLDAARFRMDFAEAMLEDLRWIGLHLGRGARRRRPACAVPPERAEAALPGRPGEAPRRGAHLPVRPLAARRDRGRRRPPRGRSDDEPVYPASLPAGPGAPAAAAGRRGRGQLAPAGARRRGDRRSTTAASGTSARWRGATSGTSRSGARTTARATSSPARSTTRRWGSPRWCAARTSCARPSGSC